MATTNSDKIMSAIADWDETPEGKAFRAKHDPRNPADLSDDELVAALWRHVDPSKRNSYATDGKCHNANPGTYGHECGKPATWIGLSKTSWMCGFCDNCRVNGHEARDMVDWRPACFATEPTEQGLQYVIPGCEKDQSHGPAQGDLF